MDVVHKIVGQASYIGARDHLWIQHLIARNINLSRPYGAEVFRDCWLAVQACGRDRVKVRHVMGVELELALDIALVPTVQGLPFKGNDGFSNRICIGGYLHGVP